MDWREGSNRIQSKSGTRVDQGRVSWSFKKSAWMGEMTLVSLIFALPTFSIGAVAAFCILTVTTLLVGHSVGLHRQLIHRSFQCPDWLFKVMVYLGTLVGMDGPVGMMRQHDLRDWAQRVPGCHAYLRHGTSLWKDYWWQIHCDFRFDEHPDFILDADYRRDPFLKWMDRTWMLQQIPLALVLFALGGWGFIVWGICLRVTVSVTGHWLVGHFAHNRGPQRWYVRGAGVQGRDVPLAALLSMGEAWHANHHAFPGSARLGLDADQPDPGWWFIRALSACGLAWGIRVPENLPRRQNLIRIENGKSGCAMTRRLSD